MLWAQVLEDLRISEILLETKRYYASVLFAEQGSWGSFESPLCMPQAGATT